MKIGEKTFSRAQKVLFLDKLSSPIVFKQTLKLELYGKIREFMEIEPDDINLNIDVLQNGEYKLTFNVIAKKLKNVGVCSNIK